GDDELDVRGGDVQTLEEVEESARGAYARNRQVGEQQDLIGDLEGGDRGPRDRPRRVDDRATELRPQELEDELDLVVSDRVGLFDLLRGGEHREAAGVTGQHPVQEDLVHLARRGRHAGDGLQMAQVQERGNVA